MRLRPVQKEIGLNRNGVCERELLATIAGRLSAAVEACGVREVRLKPG